MLATIDQALDFIYQNTKPTTKELIPIESAYNRVLAKAIIAAHNLPPYDNSAMDGFAIKFSDKDKKLKITSTIFAGDNFDGTLNSGECFKIMTGAKVPNGADTIVPIEDVIVVDEYIKIQKEPKKLGNHIRRCAEDIASGTTLLESKTRLFAHHITLLASQGISHIKVFKKPKIAIFASGNELKMHHEKVESHQLYNTNSPSFYARALELGCEVSFIGTAKDSLEDIDEHIVSSLESDLVITSGGASVGEADFTKEAFSKFDYEVFFDKVQIRPGKPTMFGKIGKTLVLNLPGNPLAAMLNFELFAKSIILALSGDNECYHGFLDSNISTSYVMNSARTTLVAGYFDGKSFTPQAKSSPGMVSPMALSNSFIVIDESVDELKQGDRVKVLPIRFSFNSSNKGDIKTKLS